MTIPHIRTLAGKVVGTGTRVLSRDGKTLTFTGTGTTADGRQYKNVIVFDGYSMEVDRLGVAGDP